MNSRSIKFSAALMAVAALALAGCGESTSDSASATTEPTPEVKSEPTAMASEKKQASAAGGKRVQTGSTRYGKILQDSRGRTLYLFTADKGKKKSRCYGDCAVAWPPMITRGKPVAIKGAKQSELGTTKRRGGKTQVTYNGHPLYYYVDEDEPGEVLCQAVYEFGGIWYVVNRNGKAITRK